MAARRRRRAAPRSPLRKDRLIQTRVPRHVAETLEQEARRQRVSVSHLIRSLVEDAFVLVDGVVADVDQIVSDSMRLARSVRSGARRFVRGGRAGAPSREPGGRDLSHVHAWSEVVLHRPVVCSGCGAPIRRGECAHAGLSEEPRAPRAWLCARCIEALRQPE